MRVAVLADIHANLPALDAVFSDVDRAHPDEVWVAGDIVGYHPWPNEVAERLRTRRVRAIRGNHDRAALGVATSPFNALAAEAIRWTRVHLTPAAVGYLRELPDRARVSTPDGVLAMYHGSPRNDDEYVPPWAAGEGFVALAQAHVVILGHTHLPMAFAFRSGLLVNPGSVGQPRDGDPRASWGLLDTSRRTFEVRRVRYEVEAVAKEVLRSGLPTELAERLYAGW